MNQDSLVSLLLQLASLPQETEWIEFKHNHADGVEIGEYISALANSATLKRQPSGYLVWGIEDSTHRLIGTTFNPRRAKVGNEELENWLTTQLSPRINFNIHAFGYEGKDFALLEVPAAAHVPVRFRSFSYIRIGSYKKKLHENPEKERDLWALLSGQSVFERGIAKHSLTATEVLAQLDWQAHLSLTTDGSPLQAGKILTLFERERIIVPHGRNHYDITNLGAILLACDLGDFGGLARKAPVVVLYKDNNRTATVRERPGRKGYAAGFGGLMAYVNSQLPENEHIGQAFRSEAKMYPEVAVRELVANAIIHQDLNASGQGPRIEIFSDRIEIVNPGLPLIETNRFLDAQPQSRNDAIAAYMHKAKICEERGSGIDKVFWAVEVFQLPAPDFVVEQGFTKSILFSYRALTDMGKRDKTRACYQHAGLQHVSNQQMTNTTLRKRFNIADKNSAVASRIIRDTLDAGLIRPLDPDSKSQKYAKYVPYWA
jgi:ATP-dependent DNA helicase RecG